MYKGSLLWRAASHAALLGLAVWTGCRANVAGGSSPPPPSSIVAGGDHPYWRVRGPGGLVPLATGSEDPALITPEACAACHFEIVQEWSQSRHALAWTNSIFTTEYNVRKPAWCIHCHAPTSVQVARRDTQDALVNTGVNCAACHIRRGQIVSRRRSPASPHASIVDSTFGSPEFCGDCHNFAFPIQDARGTAVALSPFPMQATVSQFQNGPWAQAPNGCLTCHSGEHGHAFGGAHSPEMLTKALNFALCRQSEATVVATVKNQGAGHNVPTGDVHRHINVRVWRASAPEALFEGFLGRRFEPDPKGGKRTTWDSSIAPGAHRTFTIQAVELGGEPSEPIRWSVDYVYIGNEFAVGPRAPREAFVRQVFSGEATVAALPNCP